MAASENMNLRFKKPERARLLAAATAEGRTLTGLVKRALSLYMDRYHPEPGGLAAVDAGGRPWVGYPLCRRCDHRHDSHRDAGDPRGPGCWSCESERGEHPCPGYEPADEAGKLSAGPMITDPDEGDDVEPGAGE